MTSFLGLSDLNQFKGVIQETIARLEEKLKVGAPDKAVEKKVEQLKSDLRHVILLAGTKNAQLAVAQDRILHLGHSQARFVGETTSSDAEEDAELRARIGSIQNKIRELAQGNAEAEEGAAPAEADDDAKAPKLPQVNFSRSLLPKPFLAEISARLQSGFKPEDILSDADCREKLAVGE